MPSSGFKTCALDRKSTRLNSSHTIISYAVFCLKKTNRGRSRRGQRHRERRLRAVLWGPPLQRKHHALSALACPRSSPRALCHHSFFFFIDPATPEISPLPHPDPLPS